MSTKTTNSYSISDCQLLAVILPGCYKQPKPSDMNVLNGHVLFGAKKGWKVSMWGWGGGVKEV